MPLLLSPLRLQPQSKRYLSESNPSLYHLETEAALPKIAPGSLTCFGDFQRHSSGIARDVSSFFVPKRLVLIQALLWYLKCLGGFVEIELKPFYPLAGVDVCLLVVANPVVGQQSNQTS